MIVIIEGPDGAGKTSLARELQQRCLLGYHHEGPPPLDKTPQEHYISTLRSFEGRDVVIDRFALGERVYGPALRGEDKLGADGWREFSRETDRMGVIEVICLPPIEVCLANWKASVKDELFEGNDLLFRTYGAFAYFALREEFRYTIFDYTRMNVEDLLLLWR